MLFVLCSWTALAEESAVKPTDSGAAGSSKERAEWAKVFQQAGVPGTIVVLDQREGSKSAGHWVHNPARASKRLLPASTFKVPHALFALDHGVVRDEFQRFTWDGEKRWAEAWNRDQDLRSSMRHSVVWVYQLFARAIGEAGEREYLQRIGYGNADVSGGVERFWLDGALALSAQEQVDFLQRLYRNELPFAVEHQRLVKDIMINEAGPRYILRAKTGWAVRPEKQHGWWVGWVEWPQGPVFFALNIDMPNGGKDATKRISIARTILTSLDALPAD